MGLEFVFCALVLAISAATSSPSSLDAPYSLTDALLREVVVKMGQADDYLKYPSDRRMAKEFEELNIPDDYDIMPDTQETMLRDQEYLQHSSLWGHQYVAGGNGEGKQRLKPDGSVKNIQEVKTDNVLPAYCDPPNPCPPGYTAADGCLEEFVNSAAFSREYQAAQQCMCDTEHMFDCPNTSRQDEINALAQSIQNEGLNDGAIDKIVQEMQIQGEHKNLVAKKHHKPEPKNSFVEDAQRAASKYAHTESLSALNPYLQGEQLPIVAKKGMRIAM